MSTQNNRSSLDSPRIRFNWGFHDARLDAKLGNVRLLVESGEQNLTRVSKTFNQWYYFGYAFGKASLPCETTSSAAWKAFLCEEGQAKELAIYREIVRCEEGGLIHLFSTPSPLTDQIKADARKYAKWAMES